MFAPICLFTYNRYTETKLTLEALKKNYLAYESDLFIFSDGPKNELAATEIKTIREYLYSVTGFKSVTIIESKENKGLANSIISGVTQIIEKFGKVIVLEDDLITSRNFLSFLNQALVYYKKDTKIQSINGFALHINKLEAKGDVYFQKRPFSWGWASWSNRWDPEIFNKQKLKANINSNLLILKEFEKECGGDIVKMFIDSIHDKNDSWYVRWVYNHFKNENFSVYPIFSLVENIGFGELGTHCKNINSYKYKLDKRDKSEFNLIKFSKPEKNVTRAFLNYFSLKHKVIIRIKLLSSATGRKQLTSEVKMKINKLL